MIVDGWVPPGATEKGLCLQDRNALGIALENRAGLDLAYRPQGWKLDRYKTSLMLDTESSNGFTVGDQVTFQTDSTFGLWDRQNYESLVPDLPENPICTILCFARIGGRFNKNKVYTEGIACVLRPSYNKSWDSYRYPEGTLDLFAPISNPDNNKVLLFWVRSLEKVEE